MTSGKKRLWHCRTALAMALPLVLSVGCAAQIEPVPDWWRIPEATPGANLTIHEETPGPDVPGQGLGNSKLVTLLAAGFPRDKDYELWWDLTLGGRPVRVAELGFDEAGELEIPYAISLIRFAKGQAATYAVVSTDRRVKAFANFIPFPIEARKGTCRIWLELISPDGMAFVLRGEGFEPGEEVTQVGRSDGEVLQGTNEVNSDGSLKPTLIFPATVGRQYSASKTVRGRSCDLTVDYEWGPLRSRYSDERAGSSGDLIEL